MDQTALQMQPVLLSGEVASPRGVQLHQPPLGALSASPLASPPLHVLLPPGAPSDVLSPPTNRRGHRSPRSTRAAPRHAVLGVLVVLTQSTPTRITGCGDPAVLGVLVVLTQSKAHVP